MRAVIEDKTEWALIQIKKKKDWVPNDYAQEMDKEIIKVEERHAAYFETTHRGTRSDFGVFDSVSEAFAHLDNQVNDSKSELAKEVDELYDYLLDSISDDFDYELKRKEKNKWLVKTDDVEREFTWKRKAKIEVMRQAEKEGKLNF